MSSQMIRLMKLRRKELLKLFRELPAPEVSEMRGEFRATILDQGRWVHNFITIITFNMAGAWLSKSFSPDKDGNGIGYNSYRVGSTVKKIYRMKTYVGPSRFDEAQSYHLDYGIVDGQSLLPSWSKLRSELRKLDDSIYLGVGTADFGISRFRREQPFVLEGPVAEFDESVWPAAAAA